jgi:hypothetical protein
MAPSSDEIRADIEATRARIEQDIDALQGKIKRTTDVRGYLQRNPIPFVAGTVGLSLLVIGLFIRQRHADEELTPAEQARLRLVTTVGGSEREAANEEAQRALTALLAAQGLRWLQSYLEEESRKATLAQQAAVSPVFVPPVAPFVEPVAPVVPPVVPIVVPVPPLPEPVVVTAPDVVESVAKGASSVQERVTSTVSSAAHAVTEGAHQVQERVADTASSATRAVAGGAQQAQELAAGAVVAATAAVVGAAASAKALKETASDALHAVPEVVASSGSMPPESR